MLPLAVACGEHVVQQVTIELKKTYSIRSNKDWCVFCFFSFEYFFALSRITWHFVDKRNTSTMYHIKKSKYHAIIWPRGAFQENDTFFFLTHYFLSPSLHCSRLQLSNCINILLYSTRDQKIIVTI